MTLEELQLVIDAEFQQEIGIDNWRSLNVWVTYRAMRLAESRWEPPTYSIEVHIGGESLRVSHVRIDDLLSRFRRYMLTRVVERFQKAVPA